MMQQVYQAFPNDAPITNICIVEDPSKCPPEFNVISKTHDQDSDADLWREGSLFGRKSLRYLCYSKSQQILDYIVRSISVINDKENPPEGYSHIQRTQDGNSKAWRKRQICVSYSRKTIAKCAVSDIILLGRSKQPPDGFSVAGDVNGILVCFKTAQIGLTDLSSLTISGGDRQGLDKSSEPCGGDYVNLVPVRPAPPAPATAILPATATARRHAPAPSNYSTLSGHLGLEGVPFVLSAALAGSGLASSSPQGVLPVIRAKTMEELDAQYCYDWRVERETSG